MVATTDRRPPLRGDRGGAASISPARSSRSRPNYSALKVDGKRAYDLARAGEEVELETRRVTIHSLDHWRGGADDRMRSAFATTAGRPDPYDPQAPLELADSVTLVAHVSKGTYIRSLARDIAHALGTVGHVTYLRRTKAGPFTRESGDFAGQTERNR